jgi:hypothetical protein
MRVKRKANRILLGKSEGNSILGSPGHRGKLKGKAIHPQAWPGPEGSRRLRLPELK